MHRFLLLFPCLFLISSAATTPLDSVYINSGNPAFPFPQFQPYTNPSAVLGNLATHNGVGVPHAEMEQTIRDAYRIMMNRATKPGGGVGGIDYIKYRSNPQCSEGDGYGLLGAAAMADKTTFDGMWLYIHDYTLNKVRRYRDGQESSPGYAYSQLPGWTGAGANSAADGDFDIALALLQAYKQWGEFMGINDALGNPISYKQAAIDFLTALTDTITYAANGALLSGDIGIDGYFKGGDSWAELSGWATAQNTATIGITKRVEQPGPTAQYFDYTAPAYFHAFADFLAEVDSAAYAWNIFQFRRAEASSDWLIGKLYQANPRNLPICGNVTLSDTTPSFTFTGNMGEDFRLGWRTILNQMWHGTPASSWNPSTHVVVQNRTNTYVLDMANRYAKFLWDSRQSPWNKTCNPSVGTDPFSHWGPMTLVTDLSMTGTGGDFYYLNWIPSVGSPSGVVSGNFNLMADLYRYLEIEWDVDTPGDGYLTSVPYYYHGWYRLLGLLVLSGNYHAPAALTPTANMKVYLDIDKTFAFQKDTITYTIDYRNYGSVDAAGVSIVDTLHPDFAFVSATGGGVYNAAAHTVTWTIGTVPGFKTATGIAPTKGQRQLKVVVANANQKQYRNKATISCANGTGWTSNEYPNRITSVMERNYLDIAKRALVLEKTANRTRMKPGDTVQFTIAFENTSEAGWINGGRPGVHFSFSQSADNAGIATMNTMRARLFHDAQEAYIDYGNYRVSYFLYDDAIKGLASAGSNPGWAFQRTITEGIIEKDSIRLVHETITPGQDSLGKWNQRVVVQFSNPLNQNRIQSLATIDRHLSGYRGIRGRIHKGGTEPLRLVWFINSSAWNNVTWNDDWSWDPRASQDDAGFYFPVTNDWTDPDRPDIPVFTWNPKACSTATHTINNILVEEWDGYTWRRVAGNGPLPGRDANNVVIRDTIPQGLTFIGFSGAPPLGVAPVHNNRVITWSRSRLQIGEKGTITFKATADGSCPTAPDRRAVNRAWITADNESPFCDSAIVDISCDTVIRPPVPHHLDIILDTTAIDLFNDAPFQRITMDAGTRTANAWAVIRDSVGNLLDTVIAMTWTSRDAAVVTVAGAGWEATITKAGEGSTIIVVTSAGLRPDSMAVTAIATPPWPAIVSAIMRDNNADIIPDMLALVLTDTFHVNQRLDSIAFSYRGNAYSIPAAGVTLSGVSLGVPFTTLSGIDAVPTGQVSLVMTIEGQERREAKAFTDGVCPALCAADVLENDGTGNDVLYLAFTESIDHNMLVGRQLQLLKMPGRTPIALDIDRVITTPSDSMATVEVLPAAQRPAGGDSLRLVPGSAGGIIVDEAGNRPHDLNRAVPLGLRPGPSSITSAWYADVNADGVLDAVNLSFKRAVAATELSSVVITWDSRFFTFAPSSLVPAGATSFSIPIQGTVTGPADIVTGGAMEITVSFAQFPDILRAAPVADSAAPVIDSATLYIGVTPAAGATKAPDTLYIKFSEQVPSSPQEPFIAWSRQNNAEYRFSSTIERNNGRYYRFLVNAISPQTISPGNGDSIRLEPLARVSDAGANAQLHQRNRNAPLRIVWPLSIWTITISANPFIPGVTPIPARYRNGAAASLHGTAILASTTSPIDRSQVRAEVTIYDALGNTVFSQTIPMENNAFCFSWDGASKNGRMVGSGTYLARFRVIDNGKQVLSQKMRLGVKRK
ncbi:MAG: DUF11 domain-containing protein [Chitinispirillaceae bacterium]|nr:DUF11 domain-containing protein [Chitinispirillaceae bacterium]